MESSTSASCTTLVSRTSSHRTADCNQSGSDSAAANGAACLDDCDGSQQLLQAFGRKRPVEINTCKDDNEEATASGCTTTLASSSKDHETCYEPSSRSTTAGPGVLVCISSSSTPAGTTQQTPAGAADEVTILNGETFGTKCESSHPQTSSPVFCFAPESPARSSDEEDFTRHFIVDIDYNSNYTASSRFCQKSPKRLGASPTATKRRAHELNVTPSPAINIEPKVGKVAQDTKTDEKITTISSKSSLTRSKTSTVLQPAKRKSGIGMTDTSPEMGESRPRRISHGGRTFGTKTLTSLSEKNSSTGKLSRTSSLRDQDLSSMRKSFHDSGDATAPGTATAKRRNSVGSIINPKTSKSMPTGTGTSSGTTHAGVAPTSSTKSGADKSKATSLPPVDSAASSSSSSTSGDIGTPTTISAASSSSSIAGLSRGGSSNTSASTIPAGATAGSTLVLPSATSSGAVAVATNSIIKNIKASSFVPLTTATPTYNLTRPQKVLEPLGAA
eukprot:GSA25T00005266001.1